MKVSQNTYVVSPAAGWGHHPLITKKVSVGRFVKGVPAGTCVAFTLDKAERTNYSPKADDVETITVPHIPTNNICGQKKAVPKLETAFLCPHVLAIKGI